MDNSQIRKKSWDYVKKLKLPINENLPLLAEGGIVRKKNDIESRLFAMLAIAASSYGFDKNKALEWLEKEKLNKYLTNEESGFLKNGSGDVTQFKVQIEAMWALAWALGLVDELDYKKPCPNDFVMRLPDLKKMESTDPYRQKVMLRDSEAILPLLDLAYCLHWSLMEITTNSKPLPKTIKPYVVIERRRAFEWLFDNQEWSDVSLDT